MLRLWTPLQDSYVYAPIMERALNYRYLPDLIPLLGVDLTRQPWFGVQADDSLGHKTLKTQCNCCIPSWDKYIYIWRYKNFNF